MPKVEPTTYRVATYHLKDKKFRVRGRVRWNPGSGVLDYRAEDRIPESALRMIKAECKRGVDRVGAVADAGKIWVFESEARSPVDGYDD